MEVQKDGAGLSTAFSATGCWMLWTWAGFALEGLHHQLLEGGTTIQIRHQHVHSRNGGGASVRKHTTWIPSQLRACISNAKAAHRGCFQMQHARGPHCAGGVGYTLPHITACCPVRWHWLEAGPSSLLRVGKPSTQSTTHPVAAKHQVSAWPEHMHTQGYASAEAMARGGGRLGESG